MTKEMTIDEIRALTIKDIKLLEAKKEIELMNIKEHDCYLIDLEGYFGYSILVFKNDKHIHYADDFQLHHRGKSLSDLKECYIRTLNNKLFTETELLEDVKNYTECQNKSYYVRNYWIMQFDYVSIFYIGELDKSQVEAKEKMFYCPACFCYVNDKSIIDKANEFINHIEKSYSKAQKNIEVFRKMISYELANHEACITYDYQDALDALGLTVENLTKDQFKIVKEELKKQIENYY